MVDASWPGWTLGQSGISAGAGLLGVVAGAWLTSRNQAQERKHARLREQLEEFYSPMLGMREEIAGKQSSEKSINEQVMAIFKKSKESETRTKYNPDEIQAISKLRKYDHAQWDAEVFPLYKRMIKLFTEKMWLAEDSTRAHYADLTNYVEKWNRFEALAASVDVMMEMSFHNDDKVRLFFEDVEEHFKRLQKLLE